MMCNLHTLPPRRVLLLCGGRSEEHEVSLASARSLLEALTGRADLNLEVTPLVISRTGGLLDGAASQARLSGPHDLGATSGELAFGSAIGVRGREFDVVFPLLHGPFGEDGRLQGLFEVMGLRYVGAGVLGSAVGMDKLAMKAVFAGSGLPQVDYRAVTRANWRDSRAAVIDSLAALGYPVFVKPANLGSSIGISRADDPSGLERALDTALGFDRRAVVEQAALGARELEVAVLGNDEPEFSPVGEIDHSGEFYDYETKYTDGLANLVIPAALPDSVAKRCLELARAAYAAIDGAGLARVDLFYLPDGRLLLNEINTMPGFTVHSMYPKLWQAGGVGYPDLIRRLIDLAFEER